jgi:hypothetical protein
MMLIPVSTLQQALSAHVGEIVLRETLDYDWQFWLAPFSATELERWWISQTSFMFNPEGIWDEVYRMFDEVPPPHRSFDIPGTFIDADYPDGTDLWSELSASKKHYRCEICCDSDSYLQRPDGTKLYHRGCSNVAQSDAQ